MNDWVIIRAFFRVLADAGLYDFAGFIKRARTWMQANATIVGNVEEKSITGEYRRAVYAA